MKLFVALFAFVCSSTLAFAQQPGPQNPPSSQLSMQTLAEMIRTASSFNDLVRNINLKGRLGPDVHTPGPDGMPQHSAQRTAATIGAGAGVGAAIGGMTTNKNGVIIGALIGSAGGLIIDQILKHREETRNASALQQPDMESAPRQEQLLRR